MPVYLYECSVCRHEFEVYFSSHFGSGKTLCLKCGNVAFKIPAPFNTNIFKKRKFNDGTETPNHVNTPRQEKDWMKSEGIVYDPPIVNKRDRIKENRERKTVKDSFRGTEIEHAFKKAVEKCEQGFKIEKKKQREIKKTNFQIK